MLPLSPEALAFLGCSDASEVCLLLRTCDADGTAYGGFSWPDSGGVEAPDWSPEPVCGGGLHGLLWGEGSSSLLSWEDDARWYVVAARQSELVDLGGKAKAPRMWVVHSGTRASATQLLHKHAPNGSVVHGLSVHSDAKLTLTGGPGSTLTGGDYSTLQGGPGSTLTGGYGSTLTGGPRSTLTGGPGSTLTGGDYSTLTGGLDSTLTGGPRSTLTWRYWHNRRVRVFTEYVGEGAEAGQAYRHSEGKLQQI